MKKKEKSIREAAKYPAVLRSSRAYIYKVTFKTKTHKKSCDYLRFSAKTLYLSDSFLNYRVRTLPEGG